MTATARFSFVSDMDRDRRARVSGHKGGVCEALTQIAAALQAYASGAILAMTLGEFFTYLGTPHHIRSQPSQVRSSGSRPE